MYVFVASVAAMRQGQSFYPPSEEDGERRCYPTKEVWRWKIQGLVSNSMPVKSSCRSVRIDDSS